jgi:hypothetical protein
MSDRAVIHCGDIWIAVHYGGWPEALGKSLEKAVGSAKEDELDLENKVVKAASGHTVDLVLRVEKKDFDRIYNGNALHEYEVLDDRTIKVRARGRAWSDNIMSNWYPLEDILHDKKLRDKMAKEVNDAFHKWKRLRA